MGEVKESENKDIDFFLGSLFGIRDIVTILNKLETPIRTIAVAYIELMEKYFDVIKTSPNMRDEDNVFLFGSDADRLESILSKNNVSAKTIDKIIGLLVIIAGWSVNINIENVELRNNLVKIFLYALYKMEAYLKIFTDDSLSHSDVIEKIENFLESFTRGEVS